MGSPELAAGDAGPGVGDLFPVGDAGPGVGDFALLLELMASVEKASGYGFGVWCDEELRV